jgi:gamma-glutamyltranspeptidase / glutathione hydrolase / leukotriene-C4 hydrolase
MTHEDLANYSVRVDKAMTSTYQGRENYTIHTTHPPTSGLVLIHMLNILETYPEFIKEGGTGLNAHRLVEAMKCTYADSYVVRII